MFKTNLLLFCALFCFVSSLHIPSYITPCSKKDPKFDECALEKTKLAYPSVALGDKKYKSPPLNPFTLPLIEVDAGANLALTFKDIVVTGLDTVDFKAMKFDLENSKAHFQLYSENLNFAGNYDINGHILVLPIKGNGDANITFAKGIYDYDFSWKLVKKDDGEYAKIESPKLEMKLKRAYFQLDNLFGGDKALGDNMNAVLNDNWEDVLNEIGVGISHTIETVVTSILITYFENIPFKEIFTE